MSVCASTIYVPKRFWQDPNETKRYRWNFNAWCTRAGLSVASFAVVLPDPPTTLEVVSQELTGNVAIAFIKGVETGKQYTVTCRMTSTGTTPQILDRSIVLIARSF